MEVLKLENVKYNYKSKYIVVEAVKNATVSFEEGKVYTIIGRSGSGKTTLLSVMAGLDLATDGAVYFNGKSLNELDRDKYRRENISVIYQSFHLSPLLTAIENVMYPMEMAGVSLKDAKEKAIQLISDMGIDKDRLNNFPQMLSGGEQQRIAIARALASNSKIILADEPTGNLDTENGNNVIDILTKLAHEKNYCVIIITHDLDIEKKADCVYRMIDGVLKEDKKCERSL